MFSTPVAEVFAALDAAVAGVAALEWDGMGMRERLEALDRLEAVRRRAAACSLDVVGSVQRCGAAELGGATAKVIADVIRISPAEARRRLRDAAQLQPRTTLTGAVLAPSLPATAKAWDGGLLDGEHLRAIQRFIRDLPADIHPVEVAKAEAFLAEKAAELRPDQLEVLAERVAGLLNPDGRFCDEYRAAQRGFGWCGRQRPDGMSVGRLIATPELRAMLDAWLAKFAAPGMCNPDDQTPVDTGEPNQVAVDADRRQHPQRQHDALAALVRGQLGDPTLGQHNGLPVTVIASATVEQLSTGTGHAVTAGGTLLPMRDVIRMAAHAWHYLAVFDTHSQRPIYLGRTKRIASADQRIVLHATDRGCTAPGCDMPGYLCQTHHVDDWADGGRTDIDRLTFACGPHHRLITPGGWTTRKRTDGTTEWLPPPQLPRQGGTNTYHHPERLIPDGGGLAAE
jgi:hypothetical protein